MVLQKISFLQPSLWSQILTSGKGGVAPLPLDPLLITRINFLWKMTANYI